MWRDDILIFDRHWKNITEITVGVFAETWGFFKRQCNGQHTVHGTYKEEEERKEDLKR